MAKFNTDVFARALLGRRAIARYPFPGVDDAECGLRLLSDGEIDQVRIDAQEYCKKRKISLDVDPEFFDRALHRFVVFRAFVDPDSDPDEPKQFFDSIDDVTRLDTALVAELFQLYAGHQQSMDPLKYVDEEEVQALLDALKKPGSREALMVLDRRSLLSCVLSMASLLQETRVAPR